jgi:hypothetical protein
MEIYAVLRIDKSLKLADTDIDCKLPDGQFMIPCFSDYEKAKEVAGDKFEILTFKIQ